VVPKSHNQRPNSRYFSNDALYLKTRVGRRSFCQVKAERPHPSPEEVTNAKIVKIRKETELIKTIDVDVGENDKFSFKPGQWVNIFTPKMENGKISSTYSVEKSDFDSFSIYSTPTFHRRCGLISLGVKKSKSVSAKYLHDQVKEGDKLYLTGGHGEAYYTREKYPTTRAVTLIGGGIGITPLMSILHDIQETQPDVRGTLIHTAATAADCIFKDQLMTLTKSPNINVFWTVTKQKVDVPGSKFWPLVHRNRIDREFLVNLELNPNSVFFLSGPPSLVQLAMDYLGELGVPQNRIQYEKW